MRKSFIEGEKTLPWLRYYTRVQTWHIARWFLALDGCVWFFRSVAAERRTIMPLCKRATLKGTPDQGVPYHFMGNMSEIRLMGLNINENFDNFEPLSVYQFSKNYNYKYKYNNEMGF